MFSPCISQCSMRNWVSFVTFKNSEEEQGKLKQSHIYNQCSKLKPEIRRTTLQIKADIQNGYISKVSV